MAGPLVPHVGFEVSELSLGDEPSMYTGRMTSPSTEAREAEVTRSSAQLQAVKNEAGFALREQQVARLEKGRHMSSTKLQATGLVTQPLERPRITRCLVGRDVGSWKVALALTGEL